MSEYNALLLLYEWRAGCMTGSDFWQWQRYFC